MGQSNTSTDFLSQAEANLQLLLAANNPSSSSVLGGVGPVTPRPQAYPPFFKGGIRGPKQTPSIVTPVYVKGDEYGSPNVVGFPSTAAGRMKLQQQLIAAGLLDPKSRTSGVFVPGDWGTSSANAMAELLAEANQSNQSWQFTLTQRTNAVQQGDLLKKDSTRQRTPLVISLTNPDDIKQTVQNVGKSLHGTYLSDDQLARFTAAYQQQESDYQTAAYAASGYNPLTGQQDPQQVDPNTGEVIPASTGGATLTKPPSAEAEANKAIREENPIQFQKNTFADRLDTVLSGLRGPIAVNTNQVGPVA